MKILVLLLFLGPSAVVAEVVTDFTSTCPNFFSTPNGIITPPTVFSGSQYRQICQKQANQNVYEFATLYDTKNRIPVYSAYVFISQTKCKRKETWFIEPQLDDQNKGPDMQPDTTLPKPLRGNNQALNKDYINSDPYDKGHLFPVFHTNTQRCANSTFTLTNAAPQHKSLNRGPWKAMERKLVKIFQKKKCLSNKTYVVTGVVPNTTGEFMNGRVNVPSHFWNAYCCLDNNNQKIASKGYLAPNSIATLRKMSVSNLENELSHHYGSKFDLFDGKC